jgi:hypothetical protein
LGGVFSAARKGASARRAISSADNSDSLSMTNNAQVTQASDIFFHAEQFYLALHTMHQQDRQFIANVGLPLAILTAFCCELYFKCALFIETGKLAKGHHLYDLFTRLSPKSQARLEELWDHIMAGREEVMQKTEQAMGRKLPRDLRSNLKEANKSFEDMRYLYELEKPKKFIFGISDLPRSLRALVLEVKPDLVRGQETIAQRPHG